MRLARRHRIQRLWAHKEVNLLLTSLFAIGSLYITLVSIFNRSLLSPLHFSISNSSSFSSSSSPNYSFSSSSHSSSHPDDHSSTSIPQLISSLFSLFFLWLSALCAGRIFHYARLPPLFGMLLAGAAFANIPSLRPFVAVLPNLDNFLRQSAFVLILLRCGVGLNPQTLRKNFLFCTALGILSICAEIAAIFAAAYFLFRVPLASSILFGFVLSSTSPAVTVPTMIQFQLREMGTQKGIPTMALASASIDNIFAISGFTIAFAIGSAPPDQLVNTLVDVPIQLLASFALGCLTGALLAVLPHPRSRSVHFSRTFLLCSSSMALYFGTKAAHFTVSGPISVIIACFIAAVRWKNDNPRGTLVESAALRLIWDLLLLPLLFVLIGLRLDLSIFTWTLLEEAIIILAFGLFARFLAVLLITMFNAQLYWSERVFFSSVFLPKATVQAALAPALFHFSLSKNDPASAAQLTLQTCILSILLTAPAGQLLIQLLGNKFLRKEEEKDKTAAEGRKAKNASPKEVEESGGGANQQQTRGTANQRMGKVGPKEVEEEEGGGANQQLTRETSNQRMGKMGPKEMEEGVGEASQQQT